MYIKQAVSLMVPLQWNPNRDFRITSIGSLGMQETCAIDEGFVVTNKETVKVRNKEYREWGTNATMEE
jgi:hypothetical protein